MMHRISLATLVSAGLIAVGLLTEFSPTALRAADKAIGKLFIKTEAASGQFADPDLASTIKDMKARHGKFDVVDDEAKADFLLVVLERKTEMQSPAGTPVNFRIVLANFSVRDGSSWKPACKLSNGSGFNAGSSWGIAAGHVIDAAEKCAKENTGK
jgi:hypothetical protein